jgi:hypothetical protein
MPVIKFCHYNTNVNIEGKHQHQRENISQIASLLERRTKGGEFDNIKISF